MDTQPPVECHYKRVIERTVHEYGHEYGFLATAISLDLTNMTCSGADLTKLQAVNLYLQPGTYRIDFVRAE